MVKNARPIALKASDERMDLSYRLARRVKK